MSEDVDMFEACYSVIFPPPTESLGDLQLIMQVDTIAGTAGMNITRDLHNK